MLLIDALVGGSYLFWRSVQPPAPTGPLIAANDPSPPPLCVEKPQGGDLLMAFGTNRVLGKGPGPFTPLLVDECMVLKLFRRNGGLMIQSFAYSWTNDIAFHVMDNVYEPDSALKLRALRPDRSTFLLLDRFDKEVLYVRYLNRNAVRIRGRFLCGEPYLRHHQGGCAWHRDQGQQALTPNDMAYLRGLYRANSGMEARIQQNEIASQMEKTLTAQ
jgi:hypothetical protein